MQTILFTKWVAYFLRVYHFGRHHISCRALWYYFMYRLTSHFCLSLLCIIHFVQAKPCSLCLSSWKDSARKAWFQCGKKVSTFGDKPRLFVKPHYIIVNPAMGGDSCVRSTFRSSQKQFCQIAALLLFCFSRCNDHHSDFSFSKLLML